MAVVVGERRANYIRLGEGKRHLANVAPSSNYRNAAPG
jgi:hypothetical protein